MTTNTRSGLAVVAKDNTIEDDLNAISDVLAITGLNRSRTKNYGGRMLTTSEHGVSWLIKWDEAKEKCYVAVDVSFDFVRRYEVDAQVKSLVASHGYAVDPNNFQAYATDVLIGDVKHAMERMIHKLANLGRAINENVIAA